MIVDELKNSILDYALQGKLTKQNNKDLSAFLLKEKLLNARINLTNNKKILKKSFLNNDDIKPKFQIPNNWTWVYLSNVSIIQEGAGIRKHQYKKEGIQLFSVTNILDGEIDLEKKQLYVSREEYEKKYLHLKLNIGDIVTACSGGSWGKVAIYDEPEEVMLNTSTLRMRFFDDLANNKYLYYVVKSDYFKKCLSNQLSGIQPNFGYAHYSTIPIPLPPLEEQQRIVDKIEELFAKLDELKPIEEELNYIKENFPIDMKKSILKEAFSGKLVESSKNREDIINVEKIVKRLNNKYKKIENKNLPNSWKIFKFGDLFNIINGFTPLKSNEEFWNKKEIPWFTVEDINEQGRIINYTKQYITTKAIGKNSKRLLPKNTVLLCCTASVGEYAITNIELTTNQQFNGLVIKEELKNYIYPMYVYEFVQTLKSKLIFKSGKTTFNFLSTKKLAEFEIPLPSLEEQQRIVDKIEELLPICDDIEELIQD